MTDSIENIKKLRESTGLSLMACKKALTEANGDLEKAFLLLRKQGETKAKKIAERSTSQGIVASYIHGNNKIGVLVKIECETDFVAKNSNFLEFGKDIAMHIAACSPAYLNPEEVPQEKIEEEKKIWIEQLKKEKKPENIIKNILLGKEKKLREENALFSQPFVKNPEITVGQLLKDTIVKLGENIKISEFKRISF